MKWSWKLATVAGIGVYVHATFFLLLAWVGYSQWASEHSVQAAIAGVIFILALFACVVLHEFGHALTARKYGIKTRDITLLPIGGLARLERMPDDPIQEFWVALAGPAVNVVIAAALYVFLILTGTWVPLSELSVTGGSFLERLFIVNVILVVFNMLPAFPMDGGRVLRALLAMNMDYARATNIAANVGQGMALLFGFIGLFSNPFLLFIALFVWMGAQQEAAMTGIRAALSGIPVTHTVVTDFQTLAPDDSLRHAANQVLSGSQQDFPVVEDGRVVGVLTKSGLFTALANDGLNAPVSSVMRRDFQTVDAAEMLDGAFRRLQSCNCRTMPVLRGGRLVGLFTTENVGEYLSIQAALNHGRKGWKSALFDH